MIKAVFNRIILAIAAALILCMVLVSFVFDLRYTAEATKSLTDIASAFALNYDNSKDAQVQADSYKNAVNGIRVTVIDKDGTVIYDTETKASEMQNHIDREEIREARGSGKGVSVRASSTIGEKLIYAAAKTKDGQYIRTAKRYASVAKDFFSMLPWLVAVLAVSMIIAFVFAKRFALSVVCPLCKMKDNLNDVQNGKSELNCDDYVYPELKSMAQDINEISAEVAKSLARLERERVRIDYILDNMNEGFVMLDEEDNILLINAAACIDFDCDVQIARGKNILHATRNIELIDAIACVHKNNAHSTVTLNLPSVHFGEANISKVQGEGGVIIIISDITERVQSAKMRSDFFEAASHELKTPITSIGGFAELLNSDAVLGEEDKREIFERISKETARMTSLIGDIIMISRLESGDISFEEEALDIGEIVREVCDDAKSMAERYNVKLECEVCTAVRTASRKEIGELVSNLVQNAIKYNKQNGCAKVLLTSENGRLSLSVFNTGEPIAPEYRARIFERFYRIDKSRSKAAGGTGLGLAIVKHIAGKYHLNVRLEVSAEGNTFIVEPSR